ncbi:MAG: adenylosuccinate synthase [Candidatus Cloacimonetes bacterium]|nr:adenylosuccinate synthase [Candidatus Cloacimonadota bacterium]
MPSTVVLGASWGDEGKAKIVDTLAEKMDVIVRFQGGCNAGHTVVHEDKKFVVHIIPVGILHPQKICIIGNGVVINPYQLIAEIEDLQKQKISFENRLFISSQAHITLPIHTYLDEMNEKKRSKNAIGTTKSGIGPTYAEKSSRSGIRISDLLDSKYLSARIDNIINSKKELLSDWIDKNDVKKMKMDLINIGKKIEKSIVDTPILINRFLDENKDILFEGAQGTLLDIDFGSYPFVTSSNASIGGAITGSGINPKKINKIIGVMKAYFTRVGNGPFPTELKGKIGNFIREKGQEFGATTGRPRKCGWFDLAATKYSSMINGFDEIALTKLDIYSGLKEIKICTHYEIDGEKIDYFPNRIQQLEKAVPKFISLPSWNEEISDIRKYSNLPKNAKIFIETLEKIINLPITIISVGPEKNQTIFRNKN